MCERNGISCYRSDECVELCAAANEWADMDYCSQTDMLATTGVLEAIACHSSLMRIDPFRFVDLPPVDLSCLTEKQLAAIEGIFFAPGQRQSFGNVALSEGVSKNAIYTRYLKAMRRLQEHFHRDGRFAMFEGSTP